MLVVKAETDKAVAHTDTVLGNDVTHIVTRLKGGGERGW
jgi:hypothetical protein